VNGELTRDPELTRRAAEIQRMSLELSGNFKLRDPDTKKFLRAIDQALASPESLRR
jgi:hypothetical protein